jgi:hypothetical protein
VPRPARVGAAGAGHTTKTGTEQHPTRPRRRQPGGAAHAAEQAGFGTGSGAGWRRSPGPQGRLAPPQGSLAPGFRRGCGAQRPGPAGPKYYFLSSLLRAQRGVWTRIRPAHRGTVREDDSGSCPVARIGSNGRRADAS